MTDVHDLCKFNERPILHDSVEKLKFYLSNGVPATYTEEEARNFELGKDDDEELESTTTPLHMICSNLPQDLTEEENAVVESMVDLLFEYGAGWCLIDKDNNTPGCILIKRNLKHSSIYQKIVDAGVRAELLLRKVQEIEFVDEDVWEADVQEFEPQAAAAPTDEPELESNKVPASEQNPQQSDNAEISKSKESTSEPIPWSTNDPSTNQDTYLQSKVTYKDGALLTENKDGVMMEWETKLMEMGRDSLFKSTDPDQQDNEMVILNIGFGMGIIDTFIQEKNPTKHYICEAHPDVLKKLKADGWYEKPNVVILEGRWQDNLDKLLSSGVFFNGIYYDTYSEHYQDMLELFDYVVGLLKPHGVFSFFNGLGADRQVTYEVYKELVAMDLGNYGLDCKFIEYKIPEQTMKSNNNESVWKDLSREYWSCPVYYHPEATFKDF